MLHVARFYVRKIAACKRLSQFAHNAGAPDGQPRRLQTARNPSMKGSSHQPCLSATAVASPLPGPGTDICSRLPLNICPSSERRAEPLAAGLAPALLMLHLCSATYQSDRSEAKQEKKNPAIRLHLCAQKQPRVATLPQQPRLICTSLGRMSRPACCCLVNTEVQHSA